MNVLYLTVPIALLLSVGFISAFVWATLSGQWDDLDLTPRKAILDETKKEEDHEQQQQ